MSESIGELKAVLSADTASFERGMKGAQNTLATTAKVAAAAFAGLSVAIGGSVAAASKQLEAEMQLESAFRATGKAVDIPALKELAASLQKVTTFGDETTITAMAMFARFGVGGDTIAKLTPLIQDLSVAMSMDLKTAALLVGKAMSGQVGALSRYGIMLSKSEQNLLKFGTEQEKAEVLFNKLSSSVKGASGVLAQLASGALLQLKNALGDTLEQVGFLFDRPLSKLFKVAAYQAEKLTNMLENLSPEMRSVASAVGLGTLALSGITAALAGAALAWKTLGKAALKAILPMIPWILAITAALGGVVLGLGAVKLYFDQFGGIKKVVKETAESISIWFGKAFDWLMKHVKKVVDWVQEKFVFAASIISGASPDEAYATLMEVRKGGGLIMPTIEKFTGDMKKGAGEAGKAIKDAAVSVWKDLKASGKAGMEALGDIFTEIGKKLGLNFDELGKDIKEAGDKLGEAAAGGGEPPADGKPPAEAAAATGSSDAASEKGGIDLAAATKNIPIFGGLIGGAIDILKKHSPSMAKAFESLEKSFGDLIGAFEPVISVLSKIVAVAGEVLTSIGEMIGAFVDLLSPIMDLLKGIVGTISKIAGGILGVFTKLANGIKDLFDGAHLWKDTVKKISDELGKATGDLVAELYARGRARAQEENRPQMLADTIRTLQEEIAAKLEERAELEELATEYGWETAGSIKEINSFLWRAQLALDEALKEYEELKPGMLLENATRTLTEAFTDVAIPFETLKIVAESFGVGIEELVESVLGAGGVIDGLEDMAEGLEKVNEELLNVPVGFKSFLRRFEAIQDPNATATTDAGIVRGQPELGSVAAPITMIFEHVAVGDPAEFVEKVQEEIATANVRHHGSSLSLSSPQFAGARRFGAG